MNRRSKRPRYGIRFRVIAPLLLAGLMLSILTYLLANSYMTDWKNDQMEERAERLHSALLSANSGSNGSPNLQAVTLAHAEDEDIELLVVMDRESQQVLASTESWSDLDEIPDPAVRREIEERVYGTTSSTDEELAYFYVEPLPAVSSASDQLAIIQLNGGSTTRDAWLATWAATGAIGMIALFVIGLTHSQLTRHVVEPVSLLDAALRQSVPTDVIDQLGRRRDEIGNLARTIGGRIRRGSDDVEVAPVPTMDSMLTFDKTGKILSARLADDQDVIPVKSSLVNSTIDRHLPAEVVELLLSEFDALSQSGESLTFEFDHRSYGFVSTYEGRARAFTPGRVTLAFRDMTDYKQVEREIEEFEDRVNRLLHEVPHILTTMDTSGEIRFSNRTPFGSTHSGEVAGKPIFDFVPADQRARLHDVLDSVITTGSEGRTQIEIPGDGTSTLWSIVLAPVFVRDTIDELVMTCVEMTEQRQMEERLHHKIEELQGQIAAITEAQKSDQSSQEQLQRQLQAAFEERDNLVPRPADGRTEEDRDEPDLEIAAKLAELSRSIELLERTALNDGQRRYLALIQQQAQAMTETLSVQLGDQEIEASDSGNDRARILLSELVDDVMSSFAAESARRGISIRGAVQPGMPISFMGNAGRLRETLEILISEAMKRSHKGPVEIVVSQEAVVPTGMVVRFDVYDDRTEVSSIESEQDQEALARAAANARDLGGSLAASTQANGGSLTWFTAVLGLDDEVSNQYQWLRRLRTLIVEPEGDDRSTLQEMLIALGVIGYVASDPPAIERAFRSANEFQNPYRLALIDLDTPGLADIIPIVLETGTSIVLIGSDEQADRFSPYAGRVSGFLVRPVRHSELLAVIEQSVDPDFLRMSGN